MGIKFKEVEGDRPKITTWDRVEVLTQTEDSMYASVKLEVLAGDVAKVKLFKYPKTDSTEMDIEGFYLVNEMDIEEFYLVDDSDDIEIPMVRAMPSKGIGIKDRFVALEEENRSLKKENADLKESRKAHSQELFALTRANKDTKS